MKGVVKRGNKLVFRVSKNLYPEELILKIFGEGKDVGSYVVFETEGKEKEIYEKFNELLEVIVN